MKKTTMRRRFSSIISFVLIVALLASNFVPIVNATGAAGGTSRKITDEQRAIVQKQLDAMKNQQKKAQTVDKQAIIDEELYKWAQERKEEEAQRPTKEKFEKMEAALNIANDATPFLINTIKDIADGGDFDTAGFVEGVADLASGILACIVPWGTVASIGLSIAKTILLTVLGGDDGPSEMQLMEDRLNQRLDDIANQISDVQNQLTEMSDQINASTEMIISSVSSAIENESDKNHLRDFMLSSGKDDFSYNQLRNFIYGQADDNRNGMTAYYSLLQQAQLSGGSSAEIRHYYDLLYSGLVDNRTAFHDYVTGDGFGKSIVQTYYDVLSARPDLTAEMGMSAEMATVQFAYDLYQTEMMMDQLILACNNYQYTQMIIHDVNEYNYGTGVVMARDILNEKKESVIAQSLKIGIDELRMQFAEDLVSVLGVDTSYVAELDGDFYYQLTVEDEEGTVYAPVLVGQTVYLNTMTAVVCEQFDLDAEAFRYSGSGVMDASGIVQITELNVDGTIALNYVDTNGTQSAMGAIQFIDATTQDFCGGFGTEDSPYLIASADQFLNIADGMDQHYRLIADINFMGEEITSLGFSYNTVDAEVYEEFTGVLDGNGHTISNVNIEGSSHTGIFAKIGEGGVVKNLTVDNTEISVEISEATKTSTTFTGGVLTGTNNGEIDSCMVTNSSLTVVSETTNEDAERTVYLKYGGIAGINNGQITAVLVKNTRVDVSSTHDFGGADTSSNQNNVFVGGICGTCPGILNYAGVDKDVVVKAYAKSVLNPKSTVNPYVKAYAGGITTHEGLKVKEFKNITNVYSLAPEKNVTAERALKVQSLWGKHYKNAKAEAGTVIPTVSDDKLNEITATEDAVQDAFCEAEAYQVAITDKTEKYPVGAVELNQQNLEILVNGEQVEDFYTVALYGFSTSNESFSKVRTVNVLMLFSAQIDGERMILKGRFPITIDKNSVVDIELLNYETVYLKGASAATTAMLNQTDANGQTTTVSNAQIEILNADTATAKVGTSTLEVAYQGVTTTVEIDVLCNVHFSNHEYDNPAYYTYIQSVSATCEHGGYDEYLCLGCDEPIKTNRTGAVAHNIVRDVSTDATCATPGFIGSIYCTYCNTVFEEQVEIPRLAHNIVNNGDSNNHYCTQCQKSYAHDYVVSESLVDGKVTYTYTCYSCGYVGQKQDTNIITNEERLRPVVVVSDGFAMKAGDLVSVYVDLENNPGVNGANFGIRYDERLELVEWYEGEFFAGTTTEASHAVSCGYNYVWGNEAAREGKGGNLLKLVFRMPEDATKDDAYEVAVVYSVVANSEGGFALPNDVCATLGIPANQPQKFKTRDGVIRIVDRLPGDVDNNNVVNLVDALYLSNCLVNQDKYPITTEIKHYGDVNLDGTVTINDVVKLLQSISGGYGASLLAPEYRIQLNTNGYEYDPEALFVQLYGANNTYAALAQIEQQMQQREGYKFLGWYTRLEGGEKIDAANYQTQLVSYDQDQKVQTLYAHWQKNSVSFDMNGATSDQLETETYLGNGEQNIVLKAPEEKYTVIFTDPDKPATRQTETMSRAFTYWLGSDGEKYYAGETLAVHKANMGELTLTAQWGDWELNFPALQKTGYDASCITWYTNSFLTDVLEGNVYEVIKSMLNKVLYADWTKPITYYVHYDANGGSGAMSDSEHQYDAAKQLSNNAFIREYNVTFDFGWSGAQNTTQKVTHTFQYWSRDGRNPVADDMVSNWATEEGKVVTVYAVWDTKTITLPTPAEREGYTFSGWYTNENFTNVAGVTGQDGSQFEPTGECTLYAKWNPNAYSVVYELNMMGTGNAAADNTDQCYSIPTWADQTRVDSVVYGQTGSYLDLPQTELYDFAGWYTAPTGGIQVTDSNGMVITADAFVANNTQLYAHWVKNTEGEYIYDEASLKSIGEDGIYHIVRDITLDGDWTPIELFSGTLDGHGHTISNLMYCIETTGTNTVINHGFIRILQGGTIKNITFHKTNIVIDKYKDGQKDVAVGGVVGFMMGGTIENVHMSSPTVKLIHFREVVTSGDYVNTYVGGIVGVMQNGYDFMGVTIGGAAVINNCSVTGTGEVYGKATKATKSADAQSFVGGIVGILKSGTVSNCSRSDGVKVESYTAADSKTSASRCAAGGIIGERSGGTYSECTSTVNNVIAGDGNGSTANTSWTKKGAICGHGG